MRLADFIVYYLTTYYKRKGMDGLFYGSILNRAVYIASINIGFSFLVLAQIAIYLLFKKDLFSIHYSMYFVVVTIYLLSELLDYIYIKRKRYEYVTSDDYRAFSLEVVTGVRVSFMWFILVILLNVAVTLIINKI